MGMFDTVGPDGFQIKCAYRVLDHYNIGDDIPIADGLYLTLEGWFIVVNGKVAECGVDIYNKWGGRLEARDIINPDNPVQKAIDEFEEEKEDEGE